MRIAIIDPVEFAYTPQTPFEQPLGGIRSAISYLSIALAARGHQVLLLNNSTEASLHHGVWTKPLRSPPTMEAMEHPDVAVVINAPHGSQTLRAAGVNVPHVFWCHHSTDDTEMEGLKNPKNRDSWTAYAMLSAWQRSRYAEVFGIPMERMSLLGNAISPPFESLTPNLDWLRPDAPLRLAYTSTPYRGLHLVLMMLPALRERLQNARLSVYSGQTGYAVAEEADPYRIYYSLARGLPGVDYYGSIPQAKLAQALPGHAALSYPCIFYETACIAAMESMAAGLLPIVTEIGALPETVGKYGFILPERPQKRAPIQLMEDYLSFFVAVIAESRRNPDATKARIESQIAYVNANYTWRKRAQEWEIFLGQVLERAA